MKRFIAAFLTILLILVFSPELFPQSNSIESEFGISAGAFTNFPANQNYLKENISVFYVAPYIRTGKHEFSAGILYPVKTQALCFSEDKINPRLGATAGYKFYIFDIYGRENMFIHYSFQYLRFSGSYDKYYGGNIPPVQWKESDMYINNVIGLGYNIFFDDNERFGFYYTLDYVISQAGYNLTTEGHLNSSWATEYIWNNISTGFGLLFKITPLKKKVKK
ncbi:MAG: hypothetical protein WCJ26_01065 [bacterium]